MKKKRNNKKVCDIHVKIWVADSVGDVSVASVINIDRHTIHHHAFMYVAARRRALWILCGVLYYTATVYLYLK